MKKFIFILLISSLCFSLCSFSKTKDLDNTTIRWFFIPNDKSETPQVNDKLNFKLSDYDAIYNGPKSPNVKSLYLTFDEGYENGNTAKILDILKENQVPAAFFVTRPYIKDYPDLIKRMDEEGHLVCNHTSHHPSMAKILDKEKFTKEFTEVEEEYSKVTGKEMPKFFRPPMGKYSEQSLAYTEELGYTSVFWSFAYKDWLVDEQPSKEAAKKKILDKVHNGEIALLHAVSDTNTAILDEILKELKSNGYEFKSLNDLTPKKE